MRETNDKTKWMVVMWYESLKMRCSGLEAHHMIAMKQKKVDNL